MLLAPPRVLVVGAGVGAFAAISLARRGFHVTLVDRLPGILAGASARNGRRLHLGEHYSADILPASDETSLNTGRLCFLGAYLLAREYPAVVCPRPEWWQLIAPASMTSVDAYEEHLASLRTFHSALARREPEVEKIFGPPGQRHRRLAGSELRAIAPSSAAAAGFASQESLIDLTALRRQVMEGLRATPQNVELRADTEVETISVKGGDYEASFRHVRTGERDVRRFRCVVNATWYEYQMLSSKVATSPAQPATVRLKLFVSSRLPKAMRSVPSLYFHRGVFGNHTNVDGRFAIIAAESASNLSFAAADAIPPAWRVLVRNEDLGHDRDRQLRTLRELCEHAAPAVGSTGTQDAQRALTEALDKASAVGGNSAPRHARQVLAHYVIARYARFVPAFRHTEPLSARFTTAVSTGAAHLSDPASRVHMRSYRINEPAPNFFELLPGKLTLVQLASEHLSDILTVRHDIVGQRPGATFTSSLLSQHALQREGNQ